MPSLLKTAIVTPIYKGGSRGEAKNYRPVALTSHIVRIFEKIVVKKLTVFLETNQLIDPNEQAFRAHRSCLSQLLSHDEFIIIALESKCYADVIYLDFAKAFDKVDHGKLHLPTIPEFSNRSVESKIAIYCRKILTKSMNGPLPIICVSTHVNLKKLDILFPMVP